MKLRQFITQFINVCESKRLKPIKVWQFLPQDELQDLANGESWECLEHCLALWKGLKLEACHDTAIPDISCHGCQYYLNDFCKRYDKNIPTTFNKQNACKEWTI